MTILTRSSDETRAESMRTAVFANKCPTHLRPAPSLSLRRHSRLIPIPTESQTAAGEAEALDALDIGDLLATDLDDDLLQGVVLGVAQLDLQRGLSIWVCFGSHPRRKVKPPKGVGTGHPCPASGARSCGASCCRRQRSWTSTPGTDRGGGEDRLSVAAWACSGGTG